MIEHTVTFSLAHTPGSSEETDFLQTAAELKALPGVQNFRIQRQVSAKHPHQFRITMTFPTQSEYDSYCAHPLHVAFVEESWLKEVSDFQEADFVDL
jgi:hypothetical protein